MFYETVTSLVSASDEQLESSLTNKGRTTRRAALDALIARKKLELLPKIVDLAINDPSLKVRASAFRVISTWNGKQFRVFDSGSLESWWAEQKKVLSAPNNK